MKKALLLLLIALLVITPLSSCNQNGSKDNEKESEKNSESITDNNENRLPAQSVTGEGFEFLLSEDKSYYSLAGLGTCSDKSVVIPATFSGLPVKSISERAFIA